jgi:hypothetical protein
MEIRAARHPSGAAYKRIAEEDRRVLSKQVLQKSARSSARVCRSRIHIVNRGATPGGEKPFPFPRVNHSHTATRE